MAGVVEKVRGLAGLSTIGAVAGFIGGVVLAGAQKLMGVGFPAWADVIGLGEGGAIAGGACAFGLGVVLATVESKKSLEELPLWRMAALGAGLGVVLPVGFLLVTSGTIHFLGAPGIVLTVVGSGALLGGALSTSLVALAQRAHRTELAAVEEVGALLERQPLAADSGDAG